MPELKYWQAINKALGDAMAADERVCLIGEDVGAPGGPFGATSGLQGRFGPLRVRDTPISEQAIVGAAVGAAMTGMRPVVEIMFMDFIGLVMDQLVNQAAKVAYVSGGAYHCPMVVRTVCGAGRSTGPQHGQALEAWLTNVPGLKVVWPSTPSDAYGLLRAAIADDNPVIVVENLALWSLRESLGEEIVPAPLGKAAIRREGRDITIVAWGAPVHRALKAAEICAAESIDAEVIDLRSLSPLDETAILASLAKTGRLLIVEDGQTHAGVGAHVSALASSQGFANLKAPVVRVGPPFAPVPFPPVLEANYFPSAERIAAAVHSSIKVHA